MKKTLLLSILSLACILSCKGPEYSQGQNEAISHLKSCYSGARIKNITQGNTIYEYDLLKNTDVVYRNSVLSEPSKAHVKRVNKALIEIQKSNIVFGKSYSIDFTYYRPQGGRETAKKMVILLDNGGYLITDSKNINDDCFPFLDEKYHLAEHDVIKYSGEIMKERLRETANELAGEIGRL